MKMFRNRKIDGSIKTFHIYRESDSVLTFDLNYVWINQKLNKLINFVDN